MESASTLHFDDIIDLLGTVGARLADLCRETLDHGLWFGTPGNERHAVRHNLGS
jgi:hypothetical protein